MEIVLSAVFSNTVEGGERSDAPTIKLFERFSKLYVTPEFRKMDYNTCENDHFFSVFFSAAEKHEMINFCQNQISTYRKVTRSDYLELLKLIIIFFSSRNNIEHNIYSPGAYNRARFMTRITYTIKIYLYIRQMNLTLVEIDQIKRFLLFVFKIYIKIWFTCSISITAPRSDLQTLKNLELLRESLPISSCVAIQKFKNHLWYLSSTLIALAFFDCDVPIEEKEKMVENLNRIEQPNNINRLILGKNINILNSRLSDFVSKITMKFCEILDIDPIFLWFHPSNGPRT